MKPLNICMFTNTYLPHVGGVARSVHFFAEDLRRLGHRVLIIAPEFNGHPVQEQNVVRLKAIQNFNGSDFAVRIPLPYVVLHAIENFKPDIIHSHHPFLLGDAAMRAARKSGVPIVFTHHTLYERYIHYVPLDSHRLASFVIRLATLYANLSDGVIAPSHSIARLISARGVTSPIAEIPTGVDTKFFAGGDGRRFRKMHGIPSDAWVIGHLGRLAPEKNLVFLAQAVARFMHRNPQTVFLVIGKGPSAETIRNHFQKERLADRLVLAGQQSGSSLADAYAVMNLFVFASLSETQGMVLAEAMAAGVPVIALNASGVRDIVVDGINGRLLPEKATDEQFAEALYAASEDRKRIEQWRRSALQTAREQSREVCARRLENFYLERIAAEPLEGLRGFGPLEKLSNRIKTEWKLISAKVKSAVEAEPDYRM